MKNPTTFSYVISPINQDFLVGTLLCICCKDGTQTLWNFHLTRTKVIEAVLIIWLWVYQPVASCGRENKRISQGHYNRLTSTNYLYKQLKINIFKINSTALVIQDVKKKNQTKTYN